MMRRVLNVKIAYETPNHTPTCEPIYVIVGRNIKLWRELRGYTQEELAGETGVGRTSIVNIEGGRQRLMLHILQQIATALDIPLCKLIEHSS